MCRRMKVRVGFRVKPFLRMVKMLLKVRVLQSEVLGSVWMKVLRKVFRISVMFEGGLRSWIIV